ARSAQGAANRRRPLPPRALANKIAAARYPRLIPCGYRVGREVTYMDAPGMQCFLQLCNKTGRCSHISGF
ncbi:hypothetical protein EA432_25935, partial [Escherichia coli]